MTFEMQYLVPVKNEPDGVLVDECFEAESTAVALVMAKKKSEDFFKLEPIVTYSVVIDCESGEEVGDFDRDDFK